jgi:hypothetical protein|nr:hypothetical protein [uncultured Albidiferax sp.]
MPHAATKTGPRPSRVGLPCGERANISKTLYTRLIRGTPGTSIGAYAMVLFALGQGTPFDELLDVSKDHTGLLLDESRLPQRVRGPGKKTGAM